MKFKAAVLTESRKDLSILEIEFRDKLKVGQVLIEVLQTAICGSQLGEIDAVKGIDRFLPHLLGHEALGIVRDSKSTKNLKVGDYVIAHWMKSSGVEAEKPIYFVGSQRINAGSLTTFSEISIVSENRLTKIENFDTRLTSYYATLGCAHLTAFGVLRNNLNIDNPSKLLVIGGGGIGQAILAQAIFMGISEVHIVEKSPNRIDYCETLGATKIFKTYSEISDLYQYIVDTTGNVTAIETAYDSLNPNGTLALVGVTPQGEKITIDPMPLHYGKSILGVYGGAVNPKIDIARIIEISQDHFDYINRFKYHKYQLEEINSAILCMRNGSNFGRTVIVSD